MNIHLIKTDDVDIQLFSNVIELLTSVNGPITFKHDPTYSMDFNDSDLDQETISNKKRFGKAIAFKKLSSDSYLNEDYEVSKISFPHTRKVASWKQLFSKAENYRKKHRIGNKDLVILLTNTANENNWFSTLDPANPINGFIHCYDWHYFINCPSEFPIAYEVVALYMRQNLYRNQSNLINYVHKRAVGCMNDFCADKQDITFKLRTADICTSCMKNLQSNYPLAEINHALNLFNRFRERMLYAQNAQFNKPVSELLINKHARIFLNDYDNIEIKLNPLEKTLYFLFLRYPEGIVMSNLYQHRNELDQIYTAITSRGTMKEMKQSIEDLSNYTKNSASEKISTIKKKFQDKIGEHLAKHYIIHGPNAEAKRIALDRNKLRIEPDGLITSFFTA